MMTLAGIEHGIGEVLQGNCAPSGILFPPWPEEDRPVNDRSTAAREIDLTAIPYFVWANRGAGPMRVWLPKFEK